MGILVLAVVAATANIPYLTAIAGMLRPEHASILVGLAMLGMIASLDRG